MTYHVTVGYKQNHSALMELIIQQRQYVVNQYIKSSTLAGYKQDGMTEDTKRTLTYDQEMGGCSLVLEQMLRGPRV